MNCKYYIVHQNLDSWIPINIGGSHFGHSFVSFMCPLFRHFLEHLNFRTGNKSKYIWVVFQNPSCMRQPFLWISLFCVIFFTDSSNVPVFKAFCRILEMSLFTLMSSFLNEYLSHLLPFWLINKPSIVYAIVDHLMY